MSLWRSWRCTKWHFSDYHSFGMCSRFWHLMCLDEMIFLRSLIWFRWITVPGELQYQSIQQLFTIADEGTCACYIHFPCCHDDFVLIAISEHFLITFKYALSDSIFWIASAVPALRHYCNQRFICFEQSNGESYGQRFESYPMILQTNAHLDRNFPICCETNLALGYLMNTLSSGMSSIHWRPIWLLFCSTFIVMICFVCVP